MNSITVIAGNDKKGEKESFGRITLYTGDSVSIVGATGSGKTALITDIELLAQGDTPTKRHILIDGQTPSDKLRYGITGLHMVAMITQNTKCFADLNVQDFLEIHSRARNHKEDDIVEECIDLANKFTGEGIKKAMNVTELSGGQTRALLFADAILIGSSPIILLDEIENAGINKQGVLDAIGRFNRIVVFVTHDPVVALSTTKRIVMSNGGVIKVLERNSAEIAMNDRLRRYDSVICLVRNKIRNGDILDKADLK